MSGPVGEEERKGLLSEETSYQEPKPEVQNSNWSIKKILLILSTFILGFLLFFGSILECWTRFADGKQQITLTNSNDILVSNGTHEFKPTVLMVSIDGLRADYLDRGLTPHLLEISRVGLRAEWMRPIFPTLTFPNHWALLTGLYAESHGIVANNFWDPETNSTFLYSDPKQSWDASWWDGEPIWETAGKAGLITANLMWPGPPITQTGASPTYYVPFKNKVPLNEKLDQLLQWVDKPLEDRPQLILAYEPSLDQAGHAYGPGSKEVNNSLVYIDTFARDLHQALADRNLSEIIDIVFVSDHGMTDTRHVEFIYLEKLIGQDLVDAIEHVDGWPSMGLRFHNKTDMSKALEFLTAAATNMPDKLSVYTTETMLERYHFNHNPRIAPLYIVPNIGYAVTTEKEGPSRMTKGNHGYDNFQPSMFAAFISDGPFSTTIKYNKRETTDAAGWHSTGEYHIINGFQNVELYGLICKLLGIESFAADTNGTKGFWDKYF
ncbi:hypothetical protein Clacol_007431 [Clathrus columnatus]|uniref:Phosphodiest-domain-containing protein n=1 Tax=Clathrus columnatus TaxID=1419009 RepID=A0AAV5AMM8_9AGAM|nr:hypothetical protein Clacol_007431 [Clathrus columnatus]